MTEKKAKYEVVEKEIDLDAIIDQTIKKGIFTDNDRFNFGWKAASALAKSKFVPDTFRGSTEDCMIALDMAENLGVNPVLLMQHLFIVHGRPGMDAQMSIALFNRQKRFTPITYHESGKGDNYQMVAKTTDRTTGEELVGPPITAKMVQAEGWLGKNGSKWKTIPELMYRYRSAAWLIRTVCPEAVLGLMTVEELRDMDPVKIAVETATEPAAPPEPEKATDIDVRSQVSKELNDQLRDAAMENMEAMAEIQEALLIDTPRNDDEARKLLSAWRAEMKKRGAK